MPSFGVGKEGCCHRVRDKELPLKELTELCRTLGLINFITNTYATAQLASFDLVGGGTQASRSGMENESRR